jgi:HlyD family secretion protein
MGVKYMHNTSDANLVKKKTIARIAAIFTGMMILLTFFSNTINNFSLPRVQVEKPISGALIKEVTGEGTVEAVEETSVYASAGRRVEQIKIKAGDKVKKGQIIAVLEKSELEEQLKIETIRYEKLKLALEGLTGNRIQDYKRTVEAAGENLQEAQKNLDKVKSLYDAGAASSDEFQEAGRILEQSQKDYAVKKEDETAGLADLKRLVKNAEYDVQLQKITIDRLQNELNAGSLLAAPMDGVVTELNYLEGSLISNTVPVYIIADTSRGFRFRATVDDKSSKYLVIGDPVQVSLKSSSKKIITGQISDITINMQYPGEKSDLVVELPAEGLNGGERGEIYIGKKTKAYALLVPNIAVGTDNNGRFVWVIKEKKGPLGNEFYVQKAAVTYDDSDNFKTAILQGIDINENIIVKYSKSIMEGSRVIVDR